MGHQDGTRQHVYLHRSIQVKMRFDVMKQVSKLQSMRFLGTCGVACAPTQNRALRARWHVRHRRLFVCAHPIKQLLPSDLGIDNRK